MPDDDDVYWHGKREQPQPKPRESGAWFLVAVLGVEIFAAVAVWYLSR